MELSQGASLLLILTAVAALPGLSRLLRIPSPVAEILFGIVLGKSVLDLSLGGPWLPFLADLGFLVLMFHAGMEINFSLLRGQGRSRAMLQVFLLAATFGLSLAASMLLDRGAFIFLILATTSLGLVMPILRETGENAQPFGQTILIAAMLADFFSLFGITFFVLWRQSGLSWRFLAPLPLFAGFALALWGARLWAWWNPEIARKLLLADNAQEQGVRLSLALLFIFVGLSELAHLEPVLGAFMGGCIISFVFREKELLESKISALGFGFLIPMFFIHVGMGFNAANLISPEVFLFTLKLFAAALAVKFLPCLFLPIWGFTLKDGLRAGSLLSSRLSLIIAAASIGLAEGFISSATKDSVIFLALLTCFLGPVVFRFLSGKSAAATRTARKTPKLSPP